MKIGIIIPGFSKNEGDWAIPVQQHLAKRLSQFADIHIFPIRYPHTQKQYQVNGAIIHPQGGALRRGLRRIPLLLRTVKAIQKEHARGHFDIFHAMWADEPGFSAALASQRLNVPFIVSILGGELVGLPDIEYGGQLSWINKRLTRYALKHADRVLAGSTYLRNLAAPFVDSSRLEKLALGVETDLFNPDIRSKSDERKGEFRLLHAASLVPVKDQITLFRAFAIVTQHFPTAHLNIIGDGPERQTLDNLAVELGIGSKVHFIGSIPHDRMPAYYRNADLNVLSSRHEGQELSTLEAAACGTPTVGTAVGILPDLAGSEHVSPIGDFQGLAESIRHVLTSDNERKKSGMDAFKKVQEEYSMDISIDRLTKLYKQI